MNPATVVTGPEDSSGPEDLLLLNPGNLYTEKTPEFYLEMHRRIDAWFKERNLSKFAPPSQYFKGWFFFAVALSLYLLIITETVPFRSMLPLCTLSGMSLFIFAMSFAHDACHGAMTRNSRVNMLWNYCYDIAGVSSYITNNDHMKGHHRAPNVAGIDVAIGSDVEPTFRLHPEVKHLPWHRAQHLFFPIAYALSTLHKWFILDYTGILKDRFGLRTGRRFARRKLAVALFFKAFTLFWAIALPLMVMNITWWQAALGVLCFHLMPGLLVGLTFQLTHISEGNDFPSLGKDGRMHTSRPLHTLQTNLDIMPDARWLNWLSCGLTLHVTHHLFPEISHSYLCDLAPIVEQTAKEFGVPYHKRVTIWEAITAHYRILKALGAPPQAPVYSGALGGSAS
jgi:linoleoyl-CoA desaturase